MSDPYRRIKEQYQNLRGDATELFNAILLAAGEIGIDEALAYLEQCVIEKRSAWLAANFDRLAQDVDPVLEGYKWFYEKYLNVSVPKDGQIVEHTPNRLVLRWWNACPTLEACKKLGLDTREVCRKAYQKPVQEFLKQIHPRLRFDRNYEHIRPHAAYCEEIIELEEGTMDSLEVVNSRTRRAYNLAAPKYHELFHEEMDQKEYDRILLDRFASYFTKDSLLCDAGCGPSGHIGRYLFDKGIPVLGVDIAERCVELAREYNPGMQFERCDMGELPFAADTFDGVLAYYSMIDTPKCHVGRFFREFRRVLKPGGRFLLAVKAGTTEGYLAELLGIETEIYFSLFTREEIRRYYEEQNFTIEFLEQRNPYSFEIDAERIFAIGRKAEPSSGKIRPAG